MECIPVPGSVCTVPFKNDHSSNIDEENVLTFAAVRVLLIKVKYVTYKTLSTRENSFSILLIRVPAI